MEEERFEDRTKKKPVSKGFLPLMGFVLIVASAVIAYVLGPIVVDWLDKGNVVRGFPPAGVPRSQINLIMTGIVFVILLLIAGLSVAAAMPRGKKGSISRINEKQLVKERKEMVREKKLKKKRQQDINRQMKSR